MTGFLFGGGLSSNNILSTGSTTSRLLEDRLAEIINVRDYGALGDGTTNDTAAIHNAFRWNSIRMATTGATSAGTGGKVLIFGANLTAAFQARIATAMLSADTMCVFNETNPGSMATWNNPPDTSGTCRVESVGAGIVTLVAGSVIFSTVNIGDVIRIDFSNRGTIFLPAGKYPINQPIDLNQHGPLSFILKGEGSASILDGSSIGTGNWVISRYNGSNAGGVRVVRDLQIYSGGGGCIYLSGGVGQSIEDCSLNGYRGIGQGTTNSMLVSNVKITGSMAAGGFGIAASNGCTIINPDIQSCNIGVIHCNAGLQIIGGRMEVNGTAIELGTLDDGSMYPSSGALVAGVSMESNIVGMHLRSAQTFLIAGQGTTASPGYSATYGIKVTFAAYGTFVGCAPAGDLSVAAWDLSGVAGGVTLINCNGTITGGGGVQYIFPDDRENITLIDCSVRLTATVAQLPTASSYYAGKIMTVNNANSTTINTVVAAGAPNYTVVVQCLNRADVWNWYIQ